MRVLLTTPTFPPSNSGLGNAVLGQAKVLRSRGIEVVVATHGPSRTGIVESTAGIKVERFAVFGSGSIFNPIRGDREGYKNFLLKSNFDAIVMHAWQNWATDEVLRHSKKIKGKKILYSHCISTNTIFKKQPVRSILRYLAWRPYWLGLSRKMKLLDGIVFLADGGQDSRFDDLTQATRDGIKKWIIPNSLAEEASCLVDKKTSELSERDQLIAVGSYDWQKGFDDVLRIYAGSLAKNKIPLKFFGQRKTGYTKKLEALANQLGIKSDCVTFVEGVSKDLLLSEYLKAKLFLSGSLTECQPLVLLDANAAGTPFVARSTGCIQSMPGGVSFQKTIEAIQIVDDLLTNNESWGKLSVEGRVAAREIYSPEKNMALLVRALES